MTTPRRAALWVASAALIWVALSLIPARWRLPGSLAPIGLGVFGTLAVHEKDKNNKTQLKLLTSITDYIGISLIIAVIAAVQKGADLLVLIKLLSGK